MKQVLALTWILLFSLQSFAQNTKIVLTKAKLAGKREPFSIYEVQFKVITGEVKNLTEFTLVQNEAIKGYAQLSLGDKLTAGQSTKFDEALYVVGESIAVGQTLVSHDLAPLPSTLNQRFSCKTTTAFLGDEPKTFFATISDLKGSIKIGDEIDYQNFKGQRSKGKITRIDVAQTIHPLFLIEGLPSNVSVSITITSETGADFSNASVASLGGLGSPVPTAQNGSSKSAKTTGKTQAIPVEAALQNDEVKITVHNLTKFNPDPATSQYDVFKVDYSLDYYIVDATVENTSSHEIDPGEYLLRLNFFSADGKSADEFLRLFKKQSGTNDDTQNQADAIDKMALGGTSKIKTAGVLVKYQEMIPDYEQKHKPIVDALYKKMAPGQKLRSIVSTVLAVPPSYKIEGLGTWKGTFFSKKNLIFIPLKR